ncbi:hypothetical protein GCM10025872_36850 [Barrientosiimonas endolithica]|uniref:Uncharacterized protein n=1 Tax=Barrientosiimonas endolithica TaxID=1535208 RepID=A0ABM8HG93_9MICO|nr:hypothetical protein GCM10025872_36850 [Barrientosiimonas endolithica]
MPRERDSADAQQLVLQVGGDARAGAHAEHVDAGGADQGVDGALQVAQVEVVDGLLQRPGLVVHDRAHDVLERGALVEVGGRLTAGRAERVLARGGAGERDAQLRVAREAHLAREAGDRGDRGLGVLGEAGDRAARGRCGVADDDLGDPLLGGLQLRQARAQPHQHVGGASDSGAVGAHAHLPLDTAGRSAPGRAGVPARRR